MRGVHMGAAKVQLFREKLAIYLAFIALTLFAVGVQTVHFEGRSYRQDEVWPIHVGMLNDASGVVDWVRQDGLHPPGWRLLVNMWVDLFGHHENITRFLSSLIVLIGLALTFRLAADLFDESIGLLAIFLASVLPLFIFFAHEVRPYALLFTGTVGTHWALLRWVRRRKFMDALLFVLFGIVTIYTHFYGLFFVATLFIYCLIFVRFSPRLYLLFFLVGLSFLGWLLPFLNLIFLAKPSGITYAVESSNLLNALYNDLLIVPVGIGAFLLLLGLVRLPAIRFLRFPRLALIGLPVILVALVWITSRWVESLTTRNMIILLPSLSILAAFGFRSLKGMPFIMIAGLIAITAVGSFRIFHPTNKMREMMVFLDQHVQAGDAVVVNDRGVTEQLIWVYYLQERTSLPHDASFHLMHLHSEYFPLMPTQPLHFTLEESDENLRRFQDFWQDSTTIWYIQGNSPVAYTNAFLAPLRDSFSEAQRTQFSGEAHLSYNIIEYQRKPELREIFRFGEHVTLQAWSLRESVQVQPCQALTLESWWKTDAMLPDNYSLSFVLANADGVGIANTDSTPANILTQQWQPDQDYVDERTVTVPCDAPAGEYPLLLGLYDPDSLAALLATTTDGSPLGDRVYLTTVFVNR
jgi:hypothetical protein